MAANTHEQWRWTARRVIAETLASLPPGMPLAKQKLNVHLAYPFGQRKYHPYQCWLAEVKLAFHAIEQRSPMDPRFAIVLPSFWLKVYCTYCDKHNFPPLKGGCLLCKDYHTRLDNIVHRPEWKGFRLSLMARDEGAKLVVSDWLEEQGLPEVAEMLRKKKP